jgi:plastocyanin
MQSQIYRLAAAIALLGATACGLSWAPQHAAAAVSGQHKVTVHVKVVGGEYAFRPVKLTVKKGTKVTWVNNTGAPHTVTGTKNWHFSSNTFSSNGKVSAVFSKTGTYHYMCSIHPYMTATVVVKAH